jgi:hypothetical protein
MPVPHGDLAVTEERGERVVDLSGAGGEVRPFGVRECAHDGPLYETVSGARPVGAPSWWEMRGRRAPCSTIEGR